MRTLIGVLIAAALLLGVLIFWFLPADDGTPSTEAGATSTTTVPTTEPSTSVTTTTTPPSTTTSTPADDSHVVESVEEAEEILRELWFGWFEGIYNQNEDRIREVVVLEDTVETARESFGIEFQSPPSETDIAFSESEILRSDEDCLAVWTRLTISGFRDGTSTGVEVVRWSDGRWKSLSVWPDRGDLWEEDCESSLSGF